MNIALVVLSSLGRPSVSDRTQGKSYKDEADSAISFCPLQEVLKWSLSG